MRQNDNDVWLLWNMDNGMDNDVCLVWIMDNGTDITFGWSPLCG